MAPPILATKLYLPPPRPNLVVRPRLIARLNDGLRHKLTLISAPAGFGKTTLLSAWVAGRAESTAWLSLDEGDSDPIRFLTYVVAAVQSIAPTIGAEVMAALQSSQPPPTETLLTALLNDLATIPGQVVLVLDDYHLIDARAVDTALSFLLEHLPAQLHLVLATREDPQLPLARLRVRSQLIEVRAADLRFTAGEAATFLTEVMDLDLSADHIAALEERTEGWIAGLQLAGLSMQGRTDIPGFIQAFAGDHRYIADYLIDEVLRRQSEHVRHFLLQTAILDRLSGPLCDAITGQQGGTARLEALERGNFFVVPLDDRRQWYRYHHLFGEVLAAHLRAEHPDLVATLHRRASMWYEQHGLAAEAIHHALAAADVERAADLIEVTVPATQRSRQEATLLGWLMALPDAVVRRRPVLSAAYASTLMSTGRFDGVEQRLHDAERWLDTAVDTHARPYPEETHPSAATGPEPGRRMVVVDDEAFRRLPGAITVARAAMALAMGDGAQTLNYARRALDLILGERGSGGCPAVVCRGHGAPRADWQHRRYHRGRDHPGRSSDRAGPSARGDADLRARIAACDRAAPRGLPGCPIGAAGSGRHARRPERALLRA